MRTQGAIGVGSDLTPTPPDIRIAYPAVRLVETDPMKLVCLVLGNATLPAFQRLLRYAGKKTLFVNHNHLPVPFGLGTVQVFTRVRPLLPGDSRPLRLDQSMWTTRQISGVNTYLFLVLLVFLGIPLKIRSFAHSPIIDWNENMSI